MQTKFKQTLEEIAQTQQNMSMRSLNGSQRKEIGPLRLENKYNGPQSSAFKNVSREQLEKLREN